MNIKQFVNKINNIFEENELNASLDNQRYELAFIEKVPMTEISRWTEGEFEEAQQEIPNGIINSKMKSKVGNEPRTNKGTHFFINAPSKPMFYPFLNLTVDPKFSLRYPFEMLESNLSLLLKDLPKNYYSENRITHLKNKYNNDANRYLELSVKPSGDRLMFLSKSYTYPFEEHEFVRENRYAFFEDDYIVILKVKKEMRYRLIFLPNEFVKNNFDGINNIGSNLIGDVSHRHPFSIDNIESDQIGENRLVFGAPGTGKSMYIKTKYETSTKSIRVVFHEEYSYQDFIGYIRPIIEENTPTYKFKPGPFTKILRLALENKMTNYTLIIEELNRANAPSVFGDVFQILDRDENGISEYSIEQEDILSYINNNSSNLYSEIRIPNNLNIVATMNSSDQGVFPLDTAFKRRWNYKYMPIKFNGWHEEVNIPYYKEDPNEDNSLKYISIKNFIEQINSYLSQNEILELNEDRLIGPYFLKEHEWSNWIEDETYQKIYSYLWDDISRIDKSIIFKEKYTQFFQVCEAIENFDQVFTNELHSLLMNNLVRNNNDNQVDN